MSNATQMVLGGPSSPKDGTQQHRILDMMLDRVWVCGQEFSREVGWAFGSRISELRSRGFTISKRLCEHPRHEHRVQVWQYAVADE